MPSLHALSPDAFCAAAAPLDLHVALLRDARGTFAVRCDHPGIAVTVSLGTVDDRSEVLVEDEDTVLGTLESLAPQALGTATPSPDFFAVAGADRGQESTPADRASLLRAVLATYAVRHGACPLPVEVEDMATATQDLLTDLLHLCDAAGLDFADLEGQARIHYLGECAAAREGTLEGETAPGGACILTPETMHTADDCTLHDHEDAAGEPRRAADIGCAPSMGR